MTDGGFLFDGVFKEGGHGKEMVDKAGDFSLLVIDELRDEFFRGEILCAFLIKELIGKCLGPFLFVFGF